MSPRSSNRTVPIPGPSGAQGKEPINVPPPRKQSQGKKKKKEHHDIQGMRIILVKAQYDQ